MDCAKFCVSLAILGLVGLVPSCHCAFVGLKFFIVGPRSFLMEFQNVSCGYFAGPKFFFVNILWVNCEHISEEYQ